MAKLLTKIRGALAALRDRPRLLAGLAVGALGLGGLAVGLAVGTWQAVCRDCPSVAQIYVWEPVKATRILSHDGQTIAELGGGQRRTPVSIENLPAHVPRAFIAVEDRRFYEHEGFSLRGFVRAAVMRVPGMSELFGRRTGGGSTITQQLARHMFEQKIGFERRVTRKLKELRVARELERVYTKDQILEAYINQVNYGRGHHGIESAAQWMFGKPAAQLDPAEAALLAAVINRPETYSPFEHPERARGRRNHVLNLMAEQGYLTESEAARWKRAALPAEPSAGEGGVLAPYFVEWVRDLLDDRYGAELYRSGLRVYTTLDVGMQRRAIDAMRGGWQRIEEQPGYRHPKYGEPDAEPKGGATPYLQGLFIALDPQTGAVRALVGGRDFEESKFNRAVQARRQPGSVFKPIVYTAAIASGIPASHVIYDAPLMIELETGDVYSPRNYERDFRGPLTLREALKFSINTVAVKLGMEVGLETVAQYAQRLGLSTPIPRVPSVSIGAADVVPLEVAQAFAVFATGGRRPEPHPILRIESAEGRVLWQADPDLREALDPQVAAIVRDMLQTVINNGTGYPARDPARGGLPYTVPAAGKTGTTNDATDVWFAGFTPDLVAVVWFGFDKPMRIIPGAAGGVYAAPVWGQFMRDVYVGDEALLPVPAPWPMPEELTSRAVDRESGKLATEWCPQDLVYNEIYIPGTEPTEFCDLHGPGLFGAPLRRRGAGEDTVRIRW